MASIPKRQKTIDGCYGFRSLSYGRLAYCEVANMRPFRLSGKLATCFSMVFLTLLCRAELRTGPRSVLAQSLSASSRDVLDAKQQHFSNYAQDFLDFEKSAEIGSVEFEAANDLQTVAQETIDVLSTSSVFVQIYDNLSYGDDRSKTKLPILTQFAYYSKQLELQAKRTMPLRLHKDRAVVRKNLIGPLTFIKDKPMGVFGVPQFYTEKGRTN